MSLQAMAWAYEYRDLPLDQRTNRIMPYVKIVLIALANYAGPTGTDAFPSVARIQHDTGLSERVIQYALRALEDHGTIAETPDPLVRSSTIGRADLQPRSYDLVAYKRGAKSPGQDVPDEQRGAKSKIKSPGTGCKISNDFAPEPVLNQPLQPKHLNLDQNLEDPDGSSSSATPDGATDHDSHSEDQDLLGQPHDSSKAGGEHQPGTNGRSSATGVPGDPAVGNLSSADDHGVVREDVLALCQRLRDRMVENGCAEPPITKKWFTDARLILDKDAGGRPLDKALNLIDWCQGHHFWKSTIKSIPKFRAQYDTLRQQAIEDHKRRDGQSSNGNNGFVKHRNPVDPSEYEVDPFKQAAAEQAARFGGVG